MKLKINIPVRIKKSREVRSLMGDVLLSLITRCVEDLQY